LGVSDEYYLANYELTKAIRIEVSLRSSTNISYSISRFNDLGALEIARKYGYHDVGGAVMRSMEEQFPPYDPTITKKWEMKQGKRNLVIVSNKKKKDNSRKQKKRRFVPDDHQEQLNNSTIVEEAGNIDPQVSPNVTSPHQHNGDGILSLGMSENNAVGALVGMRHHRDVLFVQNSSDSYCEPRIHEQQSRSLSTDYATGGHGSEPYAFQEDSRPHEATEGHPSDSFETPQGDIQQTVNSLLRTTNPIQMGFLPEESMATSPLLDSQFSENFVRTENDAYLSQILDRVPTGDIFLSQFLYPLPDSVHNAF
jgi:hypothetical protein